MASAGVIDTVERVFRDRERELVEEFGDYEPDTNHTNFPEWVETVFDEHEYLKEALCSALHTTPTDQNADARYLRLLADDLSEGFRLSGAKSSELNQNALRLREIAERLERAGEEG